MRGHTVPLLYLAETLPNKCISPPLSDTALPHDPYIQDPLLHSYYPTKSSCTTIPHTSLTLHASLPWIPAPLKYLHCFPALDPYNSLYSHVHHLPRAESTSYPIFWLPMLLATTTPLPYPFLPVTQVPAPHILQSLHPSPRVSTYFSPAYLILHSSLSTFPHPFLQTAYFSSSCNTAPHPFLTAHPRSHLPSPTSSLHASPRTPLPTSLL